MGAVCIWCLSTAGNLITDKDGYKYEYDYENRIVRIKDVNVVTFSYDAYGNCYILEPNFADDPDGKSDEGNPYYFTGREMDVFDNGNLRVYNYRHRYYDMYTGRFLQHDPLGIVPNPQKPNRFDIIGQYTDGMDLYEYATSEPTTDIDSYGLWGKDVHNTATVRWARTKNGMLKWAANRVGYYDNYVDTKFNPVTQPENRHWHFSIPHDPNLTWGPSDSRYNHSQGLLTSAINLCKGPSKLTCDLKKALTRKSLMWLGMGLHPLQDWVAHGTWYPFANDYHTWPGHPGYTDNKHYDFAHSPDRILRDWQDLGGKPNKPWFVTDLSRYKKTREMTLEYLSEYKTQIKGTYCYCPVYVRLL